MPDIDLNDFTGVNFEDGDITEFQIFKLATGNNVDTETTKFGKDDDYYIAHIYFYTTGVTLTVNASDIAKNSLKLKALSSTSV